MKGPPLLAVYALCLLVQHTSRNSQHICTKTLIIASSPIVVTHHGSLRYHNVRTIFRFLSFFLNNWKGCRYPPKNISQSEDETLINTRCMLVVQWLAQSQSVRVWFQVRFFLTSYLVGLQKPAKSRSHTLKAGIGSSNLRNLKSQWLRAHRCIGVGLSIILFS